MKKMIIVLGIILLVLTACNIRKEGENMKYRSVDMNEGLKMIRKDRGYVILDVRTKEEYDEGHIPGARNYPNEDIDEGFYEIV